jgi:hypothetical protein
MNGNYIKIMGAKDGWFKAGTECFLWIKEKNMYVRPSLQEFCKMVENGDNDFTGIRITQWESESIAYKIPIGSERWDVDWCSLKDFYFEHDYTSKNVNRVGEKIV